MLRGCASIRPQTTVRRLLIITAMVAVSVTAIIHANKVVQLHATRTRIQHEGVVLRRYLAENNGDYWRAVLQIRREASLPPSFVENWSEGPTPDVRATRVHVDGLGTLVIMPDYRIAWQSDISTAER